MIRSRLFPEILKEAKKPDLLTWQPLVLNPRREKHLHQITEILETDKPVVIDEIYDQIKELVKCRNPKKRLTGIMLEEATVEFIGKADQFEIGNWVYYPWSNRLVHILSEEEFIEVRTNRNNYKISPKERDILAQKKVGLIGLSVGQSVALTMAMERGFGELRLADFDLLELTNLNRIRTGLHNLGLSKVISVAREIMEIDPYLKLRCFTEGITEENLDDFFMEGGKLDLLIDECDGLDIKILARHKARSLHIPVVMEASDRGMVDVERFDLEPERPLLHGMVGDLNPEKLKTLQTNEDKIPYMLEIVGLETISTRAMASMLEIGETISTWPQLASAVTLGGGITADVVRRIFLEQYTESGRYYVDVEDIIGNRKEQPKTQSFSSPSSHHQADFGPAPVIGKVADLKPDDIEEISKAACHAPSGGNLQPWRWMYTDGIMQLKQDEKLISSFLDHKYIASYIALGASLENASLAAKHKGYTPNIEYFPNKNRKDIIANISFASNSKIAEEEKYLATNLYKRETNRNIEPGKPIRSGDRDYLQKIATANGSELIWIEDVEDKNKLGELIAFAERFRIMHPIGHRNFNEEMRWSKEEAESSRDGIDINTVDLTAGELAGFKLARHERVIEKLREWGGGTAFEKLSRKSTGAASALGIIARPDYSPLDFLKAGRDLERVWIGANAKGIGFQPQSPITLILQRLEDRADLNTSQTAELALAHQKLNELVRPLSRNKPVFIFRLFYSDKPVIRSLRRDREKHFQISR